MAIAREKGCFVLACSSDSTDHYEKYLDNGANVVIQGEGEITLLETVKHILNGTNYETESGIIYRIEGNTRINPKRPVIDEPDLLPMAAWDLAEIPEYKRRWIDKNGYFSINMATTRGCPFKCNWCAKPIYGNRYNSRSPEKVVQEIEYLQKQQFNNTG